MAGEMMLVTVQQAAEIECVHPNCNNCIADRCMAWRWGEPLDTPTDETISGQIQSERPGDGWKWEASKQAGVNGQWRRHERILRGYCGLAGRP
jgi:hypothetical protein